MVSRLVIISNLSPDFLKQLSKFQRSIPLESLPVLGTDEMLLHICYREYTIKTVWENIILSCVTCFTLHGVMVRLEEVSEWLCGLEISEVFLVSYTCSSKYLSTFHFYGISSDSSKGWKWLYCITLFKVYIWPLIDNSLLPLFDVLICIKRWLD